MQQHQNQPWIKTRQKLQINNQTFAIKPINLEQFLKFFFAPKLENQKKIKYSCRLHKKPVQNTKYF